MELQQDINNLINVIEQIGGGGGGGGEDDGGCTANSDGDDYTVCAVQ